MSTNQLVLRGSLLSRRLSALGLDTAKTKSAGAARIALSCVTPGSVPAAKNRKRCSWAGDDPLMRAYHDEEWGVPQRDSRMLWEMLMLEGFQAGLAWITVLKKRQAFRRAFAGFNPKKVARFGARDIKRLMNDAGIIRARAKIEATVAGARLFCEMRERGEDFAALCWSFTDGHVVTGTGRTVPS